MDLRFTDDENAFRHEVRAFFRDHLPPEIRQRIVDGLSPLPDDYRRWTRILHDKGWAVPHWPVEWGGTGWDPIRQYIYLEELSQAPAPAPIPFGVNMVGPVIYTFGSGEQKAYHLPRIATLEHWWAQGFSEPDAGSDLASLKTRAVRDGNDYVVNGQKTWTTYAQHADWIFCLVRTDPSVKKQQGISFLLVDMRSPGITVRPIQTIDGGHEVNEVFFDDVRVPLSNRVGDENRGWDYAKFLLGSERVNIARVGVSKERIRRIRALAALQMVGDDRLIDRPEFRRKVAEVEVRLKALEMTQLRVLADDARAERTTQNPAASILKIEGSRIQQATSELLMEVVGPYAIAAAPGTPGGNEPAVGPDWAATIAPNYFNTRKVSIYGGSNEIQKGIIAKAILGL